MGQPGQLQGEVVVLAPHCMDGPASMRRRRSLWRVFVLILGLILLTVAVFYAIGYALAKAIV